MNTESAERFEKWLKDTKEIMEGAIKEGGTMDYVDMMKNRIYVIEMVTQRFNECKTKQPFGML